jgi:23S rRNA (uracil1939-C5)-methyltransferase
MNQSNDQKMYEVDITSLSSKKGNGRGDGVEVPFTMPGDRVIAKLLRKRSGLKQCRLESIVNPAPERIVPRCIHFGICGGCRWQHMPYELQLQYKEAAVRRCFADFITPEVDFRPIHPCATPWGYRNKMEFSFSSNAAGEKFLGLNMDGGRGKVLNLTECHLVSKWQIDTLKAVREWWEKSSIQAYHPYRNTGSLRTLILREGIRTGDRMAMLTVSGNPDFALHKGQIADFVSAIKSVAKSDKGQLSIFMRIQQIAKGRPTMFYEMQLDGPDTIQEELHIQSAPGGIPEKLRFKISPAAFFQPNTLQAEQLYSLVLQLGVIPEDAVVYDLYCGTGTLGLSLAKKVKQVIGVELAPEAVLDAKANAALNNITNATIIGGFVGEVLGSLYEGNPLPPPDVVIVDPPRAGLEPKAIEHLIALAPPKIIYISCNPASQAENCAQLIQNGYRLEILQPVDQFPQTVHIENIALLIRL